MLQSTLFRFFASLLLTATLMSATTADAQCSVFNKPAKAKTMKVDMVRTYAPCPNSQIFAPNTATSTGIPACGPAITGDYSSDSDTSFDFGAKGKCNAKLIRVVEDPCSTGSGVPCSNLKVKSKCSDVLLFGANPATGSGWELVLGLRVTMEDQTFPGSGMTLIDLGLENFAEVRFDFEPAINGKLKLKGDYASDAHFVCIGTCSGDPLIACDSDTVCSDLGVGTCQPGLGGCTPGADTPAPDWLEMPACANVEIVDMLVRDPNGQLFARPGLGGN